MNTTHQDQPITQHVDGIPYQLKSPYDFSFLRKYGTVFKVFDDQDSGNICFGATDGAAHYFIKFAGAPTVRGCISPQEAIANLKATAPVYRDLAHPSLIRLIKATDVPCAQGDGYAMVFDWAQGDCMGRMYPQEHERFMALPIEHKLRVFEDVLAFHAHVAARGYVAIDFYDGSILYDAQRGKTTLCDIDFYQRQPYVNEMGRLWGSSRFMSPEEFEKGAVIDEVTNVYTMGATAFALFSGFQRSAQAWPLPEAAYAVVRRAVSDARGQRQRTIAQLLGEWHAAL